MVGLSYLDATTGELCATELPLTAVIDELVRVAPRECSRRRPARRDRRGPVMPLGPIAQLRARYRAAWNAAEVPDTRAARRELGAILPDDVVRDGDHHGDHDGDHDSEASALAIRGGGGRGGVCPRDAADRRAADRAASAISARRRVVLDEAAIANLELTETLIGKRKQGSRSM